MTKRVTRNRIKCKWSDETDDGVGACISARLASPTMLIINRPSKKVAETKRNDQKKIKGGKNNSPYSGPFSNSIPTLSSSVNNRS